MNTQSYTDYVTVHNLALSYKEGNKDAGLELINRFGGFLDSYKKLITTGEYNISNYSIRQFIRAFVINPQYKKHVNHYMYTKSVHIEIQKAVRLIVGIFSSYDNEDIHQEIIIAFLKMVTRYKDTKPSFHKYVLKCFHLTFLDHVKPIIKNSSVNNRTNFVQYEEVENLLSYIENDYENVLDDIDNENSINNSILSVKNYCDKYSDYFLDDNWMLGVTCSDIFKNLTKFERMIILESTKHTDQEIADRFGTCRATINRRKLSVRKKLENILIDKNLLK